MCLAAQIPQQKCKGTSLSESLWTTSLPHLGCSGSVCFQLLWGAASVTPTLALLESGGRQEEEMRKRQRPKGRGKGVKGRECFYLSHPVWLVSNGHEVTPTEIYWAFGWLETIQRIMERKLEADKIKCLSCQASILVSKQTSISLVLNLLPCVDRLNHLCLLCVKTAMHCLTACLLRNTFSCNFATVWTSSDFYTN